MLSRTVHSCINIHILELHFWTVIIWLVMHIITCLEYEQLGVLFMKYVQFPIIKITFMAIIEEHLGV